MSAIVHDGAVAQTEARKQLAAAQRILKAKEARNGLIAFTEFTMPHPSDPDDPTLSRYDAQYFHKALGAALEEVEKGSILRLIITFPPGHGKSELTSRRFPAWLLGRDPYRHVMLGTYNQPFADDFGKDVRAIMETPQFRTVFPESGLKKGRKATDSLGTEAGGVVNFVGRGGSATGRGADVLIIDDPIKDRQEANSETTRNEVWDWFNDTVSTRLMSDTGAIIIIQTRWHEDDLVGRLTDPENPHYSEEEAAQWKIINIKAIADETDVLKRPVGEPLWPGKFGLPFLLSFKRRNPVGFSALYQQSPTPEDGEFFKKEDLVKYLLEDKPRLLRIYAASDHAVATKQENDRTCLLIAGVDSENEVWLLDAWWKRAKTDIVVEAMIDLQRKWHPLVWAAEKGHISQSIGPFLRKRMLEEDVFINIREQTPIKDKMTRAQAIQARTAQKMVHFPAHAHWCADAIEELLKFPQGRFDDFADAFGHLGMLLSVMVRGQTTTAEERRPKGPKVGTLGWVKKASNDERRYQARIIQMRGM
jgi:predicted phage terminase large subunit-like protein